MFQTKKTLQSSGYFSIAIFDSSQLFKKIKHHRKFQSLLGTLLTSRCFVKPNIHANIDELELREEQVPTKYANQPIPSAHTMPNFETLPCGYNQSLLNFQESASTKVDFRGDRVDA